jgi:hypothetical protein
MGAISGSNDSGARTWEARRLNEDILCTLVAREWAWRGRSVLELALGPPPAWLRESPSGSWITQARAGRVLRALDERLRQAECAVHRRTPLDEPLPARVRYAIAVHASALARRGRPDHPECLWAEARVLEAEAAARESIAASIGALPPADLEHLRIAALRRRWEAAERSERASSTDRVVAFRRLLLAALGRTEPPITITRSERPVEHAGGLRASARAGR